MKLGKSRCENKPAWGVQARWAFGSGEKPEQSTASKRKGSSVPIDKGCIKKKFATRQRIKQEGGTLGAKAELKNQKSN